MLRIGVAPAISAVGTVRHLLESLGSKLAVLGPPRLVAEVPSVLTEALEFFARPWWHEEARLGIPVRAGRVMLRPGTCASSRGAAG